MPVMLLTVNTWLGSDSVCHLRALFRSEKGQWDAYWTALAA
jgi:hypothetical protein